MADDEEHTVVEVKQQETVTDGSMGEQGKGDEPKEEAPVGGKGKYSSFISTTDSMKAAARTKVDTIISQVRLALQSKDGSEKKEEEDVDKKAEGAISVSDEEVELKFVDALCDSMVGGSFDLELNYDIQDPFDILAMFELFERVSTKTKFQILVVLYALLKKSVENLQTCTKAGLITTLLDKISAHCDEMIADKMVEIVGVLATYSITIKELKYFLASLQMCDDGKWPRHAFKLLGILTRMPEKHGPDVYFDFSGKSGSGIVVPPMLRWPHQPGFSFSTWLQLDAAHLSSVEQNMKPHIYSFMNNKGIGYTAHFSGPMLVLEVHGKANRTFTTLIKFDFRPQIWYHVCVSHVYNRFKSSEIRCYVNGKMVTCSEIHIQSSKEPMEKCFIGFGQSGNAANHKFSFKGQMSAVYLFGEPLSHSAIAAIYRLGPGYKGKFKFESELDIPLYEMDRKTLFDGKLAASIVFTFNPKAVEGQLCLESSPNDSKIYFMHTSRAIMLEGVQSVVTQSLQAALHSLGGIQNNISGDPHFLGSSLSPSNRHRAATWGGTANQPLSAAFKPAGERLPEGAEKSANTGEASNLESQVTEQALTLEERLDLAFKSSCVLLREILFDFASYFSRVLVGSRGQDLISDGLASLKAEESTVELVMLLCSQEWQNSLQKHAGAAFVDMIDEGRMISHSTRERIVITASEARDILKEKKEVDNTRHAHFQDICAAAETMYQLVNRTHEEFFKARRTRDSAFAEKLLEEVRF